MEIEALQYYQTETDLVNRLIYEIKEWNYKKLISR